MKIQRNTAHQRWKQASMATVLGSSLMLGVLAAQEPGKAAQPPAPGKAVAPSKEAPAKAAPAQPAVQKAVVPQPPAIQIQGGVQFQIAPRVLMGQIAGQPPGSEATNSTERVKLPVDPRARRKIDDAKRFIELQDWPNAVKILQMLLDANEDNFLQEAEAEKGRRVSVRAEANRLLGSLPREGKLFYEQQFGAQAKLALKLAKANSNPAALADVALKYVHTEAGAEAAALLGSYHLDHGRYIVAALCYERLMSREEKLANLPATTLLKATLAFERAGDAVHRDQAWSAFQAKLNQGGQKLPPAVRSWDEARFKQALAKSADSRGEEIRGEWTLFMGSPDRTAHSLGSDPFLEPMFPPYEPVVTGPARTEMENAARKIANLGFPLIPGNHPLVVRHLVIFRGLDGLHAFNLQTGQMEWNSASDASLANMLRQQTAGDPESLLYVPRYRETAPHVLTENTLLGTLSADQELVYAVEDMAVPPMTSNYGNPFGFNPRGMPRIGDKLTDYSACNHLTAFDIEGGRVVWSIGTRDPDSPFTDMFFLGPPLPLGEKLYVLGESNAEIKLLCLQTRRTAKPSNANDFQYSVELVWSQPLGVVDRRITEDPVRRTQAASLSYSDGILICSTNAGSIVGVDLLTRSLVWAYSYHSELNNLDAENVIVLGGRGGRVFRGGGIVAEPMYGTMQWSYSAPVISGGKVLLAPPDGKSLHAIHLRDGTLAWTVNRLEPGKDNASKDAVPPDHYLAGVFEGKVILVGKQSIRALDLNNGKQLWRTPIPMPIGRGIANAASYFVPVRNNEIWKIALNDGHVQGKSKALHKETLGNLVLVGDELVSLSLTGLMVYPQQAVKERQVAERLKKNPNDPVGRLDRGELRWHQGDREGAMADFRAALTNEPPPTTKALAQTKLFEASCELLDQDFLKHETLLVDTERLIGEIPPRDAKAGEAEKRDRQSRYLRILARGREAQGRFLDALQTYQQYGALDNQLIASPEDPNSKVLPWVWARGQVEALARRLKPEQKTAWQDSIQQLWQKAQADQSLEAMKQFADFFGEIPGAGQEAQLLLAEKLLEKRDFAQAQVRLLPLMESSDAKVAARAVDALARLNMRLGELENAAYYFRLLAKRYPTTPVRDGKNGLQLYREITTDKRFLPYLDEQRGLAGLQEFSIDKETTTHNAQRNYSMLVNYTPDRELPPQLDNYAVQVEMLSSNMASFQYVVRDRRLTKPVLQQSLNVLQLVPYRFSQTQSWPNFAVCGSTLIFAWGNRIVAVDPGQKKELWTLDVLGDTDANPYPGVSGTTQILPHPQLPNRFQLLRSNNVMETLGTIGPGSSQRIVAIIKDVGLVGLNPHTGHRLWTRAGVSCGSELFGDSEYVIVVPGRGERDAQQTPMAVRLSDGQSTLLGNQVIDWYRRKVQQVGRRLLLREQKDGDQLVMLDPLSGAAEWTKTLDKNTLLLPGSGSEEMVGILEPGGRVEIIDVPTGAVMLKSQINPVPDLASIKQGHLLQDQLRYYLFLSQGMDQKTEDGGHRQLFSQHQRLRSIPVQGPAFALDRISGKVLWQESLPLQYVLTQSFDELPVLLCAAVVLESRTNNPAAPPGLPPNAVVAMRNGSLQTEVKLFSKATGKALPCEFKGVEYERFNRGMTQSAGLHELAIEPATGKVELRSTSQRYSFRIVPQILAAHTTAATSGKAKED